MGFEINVMDCTGGNRNNEITLLGKGGIYGDPSLMGVIQLVE